MSMRGHQATIKCRRVRALRNLLCGNDFLGIPKELCELTLGNLDRFAQSALKIFNIHKIVGVL